MVFNLLLNMLYHNKAESMQPYSALMMHIYRTLFSFSTITSSAALGHTSIMISTNSPSNLITSNLSSGTYAFRYAPGISVTTVLLPLCATMTNVVSSASRETVGDDVSSCVKYLFWTLPSAHVLPFNIPFHFSLSRLMALIALCLISIVRLLVRIRWNTSLSCNCLYSFKTAAIASAPCFWMPLLAVICVKTMLITLEYMVSLCPLAAVVVSMFVNCEKTYCRGLHGRKLYLVLVSLLLAALV
mmetsp:Transcript_2767/g.3927  ORF Transcript_2767/g.3927 Transcript_2767/m.3927 type:complete len:243 (-) Transcript_2767:130-858(-)